MSHLKARLFALVIILVFVGSTYYNWQHLLDEGRYSLKLATFSPLGVLAGSFLLLFPEKGGKPETTKDKMIAMLVFGIGLVAGLCNLYLMDPGFFGK